jgi:hypothetical protein
MDHTDVVARIKSALEAKGVSLTGPDGAFEITGRVAWELRGEGAGLLDKPGGNQSHGFATDIICYPDGQLWDILGDGGGANNPQWNESDKVDPSRYRPAKQMDPIPVPPPNPDPTLLSEAVKAIAAKVEALTSLVGSLDQKLDALAKQSDANTEKIQQQVNQVVKDMEKSVSAAVPLLGGFLRKP